MPEEKQYQTLTMDGPADPRSEELAWDPELADRLYRLLYLEELGEPELDQALADLEQKHKGVVYAQLIYLLSHLRLEPEEAKECWQRIVEHRVNMQERLGSPVDLRVALVSYFVQVNRKLKNPKVIELKLFEQTQASVYRDELTGLHNYRFFCEYLTQEIRRAERLRSPVSLVMLDVDNFKLYNDLNGHDAGNDVLAVVGGLLSASLRKMDISARYGGEEFALILPATPKVGAQLVAERARRTVEQHSFSKEEGQPGGKLTISAGVATYPADAADVAELVRRADRAMYLAKASGRNQVQLYGHSYRSYRRIPAALAGRWRVLGADSHPLKTVDISEGGVLFLADHKLPEESLVDINLTLPDLNCEIAIVGRVVHAEEHGIGEFEIAVSIASLSSRDQALLSQYIREATPRSDAEDPGSKL